MAEVGHTRTQKLLKNDKGITGATYLIICTAMHSTRRGSVPLYTCWQTGDRAHI